MKKLVKILAAVLVFCAVNPLTFGISKAAREKIINQIRADYNKTNENSKNYKMRSVTVKKSHNPNYLGIGDSVRFYTENGVLRKVIVFKTIEGYDGETEKWVEEIYVKNGKPYFIAETHTETDGMKLDTPNLRRSYYTPQGELVRVIYNGEIMDDMSEFEETGSDKMSEFNEIKKLK